MPNQRQRGGRDGNLADLAARGNAYGIDLGPNNRIMVGRRPGRRHYSGENVAAPQVR